VDGVGGGFSSDLSAVAAMPETVAVRPVELPQDNRQDIVRPHAIALANTQDFRKFA